MANTKRGTSDPFAPSREKSTTPRKRAEKPPISSTRAVFHGFPDASLAFFRELDAEQDRDWFLANKTRYQTEWVAPMEALMATLAKKLVPLFPAVSSSEPKIHRIYRDLRFSLDRTPFKTHISAMLPLRASRTGEHGAPAFYIQLGIEPFVAMGQWMLEPNAVDAYRKAVADDKRGAVLARDVARATAAGMRLASHETLKRVPSPWTAEHPRAELLKHKGIAVGFPTLPPALIGDAKFVDWIVSNAKRAAPIVAWVDEVTATRRSKR